MIEGSSAKSLDNGVPGGVCIFVSFEDSADGLDSLVTADFDIAGAVAVLLDSLTSTGPICGGTGIGVDLESPIGIGDVSAALATVGSGSALMITGFAMLTLILPLRSNEAIRSLINLGCVSSHASSTWRIAKIPLSPRLALSFIMTVR